MFSVISRTLVGVGVLPINREAVGVFISPSRLGTETQLTRITVVLGALGTASEGMLRMLDDRNPRTDRDHRNYSIAKINQNTEKSSRDPEETCDHSDYSERPSANARVKNSLRVIRQ